MHMHPISSNSIYRKEKGENPKWGGGKAAQEKFPIRDVFNGWIYWENQSLPPN